MSRRKEAAVVEEVFQWDFQSLFIRTMIFSAQVDGVMNRHERTALMQVSKVVLDLSLSQGHLHRELSTYDGWRPQLEHALRTTKDELTDELRDLLMRSALAVAIADAPLCAIEQTAMGGLGQWIGVQEIVLETIIKELAETQDLLEEMDPTHHRKAANS